MKTLPRLVISATRGGSGKTTIAIGITAAWRKQGRQVAVFKKGPDFIDAGWLGAAAGRPCYNLDLFMMEQERIERSFGEHSEGADVSVIEGNRGLFDGVDESGTYSTARLAKLLKIPVVLIVDGTKASSTVAAVVLGCQQFDTDIKLHGIILNNVSPGRHETVIRNAVEQHTGLRVVGSIPRQKKSGFPERHMGLTPFQEHPEVDDAITASRELAEKYLDLDALWSIATEAPALEAWERPAPGIGGEAGRVKIGVLRDTAFQFYYPDNLEALEQQGAQILEVNALRDKALPDVDALYIGGGFPETQAAALAENTGFCREIKAAADNGLPIYAECGGLIYLGRSLKINDTTYPMTSVFPLDFVLEQKPQAHGYTVLEVGQNSPFLEEGTVVRGHEFHYSRILDHDPLPMAYHMTRGAGIEDSKDGIVRNNVIGSYTHIHVLSTPEWAGAMILKAREEQKRKRAAVKAGGN